LITSSSENLNVTNNWWGTTDIQTIEKYIFDTYDDTRYSEAIYYPFLTSPIDSTNKPPIANAGPDKDIEVNENVYFELNGTFDPNEDTLWYTWDFGDGTIIHHDDYVIRSHKYTKVGNYTFTITVTDYEFIDSDSCIITVRPIKINQPPVVESIANMTVYIDEIVYFNDTSSYDPDGDPITFFWNFGDGDSANGRNVSHIYSEEGTYSAKLTVHDGKTSTKTEFVITVVKVREPENSKPIFISSPLLEATVGIKWNYTIIVTDKDVNDTVSINTINIPDGMTLENLTLYWIPTKNQIGNNFVEIRVTDGKIQVYQKFNITVQKKGIPPIVISSNIENNSKVSVKTTEIMVNFSASMNRSSVVSALLIDPNVEYTLYWGEDDTQLLIKINEFIHETNYKIIIDSKAKDTKNNALESNYELFFTTEVKVTTPDENENGDGKDRESSGLESNSNYIIIIVLIVVIIVIVTLGFIFKNRRKEKQEIDDERIGVDGISEFEKTDIDNKPLIKEGPDDNTNNIIIDLESKALSKKKSSDFNLSKENMLQNAKKMLENGEISRETYQSIEERLIR
jgi:PKD repeat protein